VTIFLNYLEWFAIVSFGFIGGVYFAFSFFVMQSLNELNRTEAIKTMVAINKVILKSPFMALFFGSTFLALSLLISSFLKKNLVSLPSLSGAIFLIGMFLCTALKNVPLNKELNKFKGTNSESESEAQWSDYYLNWTKWNHVRTAACFLSTALLIANQ
tara:strand:- start:357 stop:830 length:474 start_codon:yes stop_codon:yes gene_type:complete